MIERALHTARAEFYDRVGTAPGSDAFLAYVQPIVSISWPLAGTSALPRCCRSPSILTAASISRTPAIRLRLRMLRGRRRDGHRSGCLACRRTRAPADHVRAVRPARPLASQRARDILHGRQLPLHRSPLRGCRLDATALRSLIAILLGANCLMSPAEYRPRTGCTAVKSPGYCAPPLTSTTRWSHPSAGSAA